MPTYVYECPKCKNKRELTCSWDTLQDKKEEVLCWAKHPEIIIMKRIIAPTSFVLKGKGWAKDGYSQ